MLKPKTNSSTTLLIRLFTRLLTALFFGALLASMAGAYAFTALQILIIK